MFKFAQKFGKDSGIFEENKKAAGVNLASIRDLV